MKTIQEYEDEICRYDMSYFVRSAARAVSVLRKYTPEIQKFAEMQPHIDFDISADRIRIYGADRESLMQFLQVFGGTWKKEPNTFQSDKMDYVQEVSHPWNEAEKLTLIAEAVPPPPSCYIEEYEVEEPARKVMKKRIVCKEENSTETEVANEVN